MQFALKIVTKYIVSVEMWLNIVVLKSLLQSAERFAIIAETNILKIAHVPTGYFCLPFRLHIIKMYIFIAKGGRNNSCYGDERVSLFYLVCRLLYIGMTDVQTTLLY